MEAPPAPRHELIGHTADVGLRASAPDLSTLLEEAALALAEASADVDPAAAPAARSIPVELAADDLAALAFMWLNELIGVAQGRGGALAGAVVTSLRETAGTWRLTGRARLVPFARAGRPGTRSRLDVKSATFHRLTVRPRGDGWEMTAFLDV